MFFRNPYICTKNYREIMHPAVGLFKRSLYHRVDPTYFIGSFAQESRFFPCDLTRSQCGEIATLCLPWLFTPESSSEKALRGVTGGGVTGKFPATRGQKNPAEFIGRYSPARPKIVRQKHPSDPNFYVKMATSANGH